MTLAEMKTMAWRFAGEQPSEPYTPAVDLVVIMNEAAIEVATATQCMQTWVDTTTVAGDDRYPLPTDFLCLKDVYLTVGTIVKQLEPMPNDKFARLYASNPEGEPLCYMVEFGATSITPGSPPGDVRLGPSPPQAYPLRIAYFQLPSRLVDSVDDNNSYELPIPFHKAVCYQAAMNIVLHLDDTSRAAKLKVLYDDAIMLANNLVGRMNRSEPAVFERAYGCGRASQRRKR